MILETLNFTDSYFMLLYCGYNNDMNIFQNGEIYPELSGQNFPGKVAEWWETWYRDPKMKYKYIKKISQIIPSLLPVSDDQTQEIIQEGMEFRRFANPSTVTAQKLASILEEWQSLPEFEYYEIEENRRQFVEGLNTIIDA